VRILIVRLSALGDVCCTLPVACALKDEGIATEIVWIADKRFAALAKQCDAIDEVITLEKSQLKKRAWVKELGEFDVALDMQGLLKSGLLVGAARAKRRLGFHWQREGARLFSSPVMPDPSSLHVVDQYVDVARALGCQTHRARFGLAPAPDEQASVAAKLAERGVNGPGYALINAGAGWASKRWSPAKNALLAAALMERGRSVVFLGAPGDRPIFEEVQSHCSTPPVDMVGHTSVAELTALIHGCAVHIGGDTGSTHIAAALGRPCVGIYKVNDPRRTCPYGQFIHTLEGDPDPNDVLRVAERALAG